MENNPLNKALDKAAEILQFAFDNAHKPIDSSMQADILAKLEAVEKSIKEFEKENEALIKGADLKDFTLQMMMMDTANEQVTEEQRQLLLRAEELKSHALAAQKNLLKASKAAQQSNEKLTDKSQKKVSEKSPKSRKSKFRSMGGSKNWKPL
jgi:hypothetical protein